MLPQHKGQKELGTRQLFPGMHASTYPQAGSGPGTVSQSGSFSYSNNTHSSTTGTSSLWAQGRSQIKKKKKNSSLKVSESKGHQSNSSVKRKSCLQTSQGSLALPAEQRLLLWHQAAGLRAPWLLVLATFQNHKYIQGQPRQQQSQEIQSPNEGRPALPSRPAFCLARSGQNSISLGECPRCWPQTLGTEASHAKGQLRRHPQPVPTFLGGCGAQWLGRPYSTFWVLIPEIHSPTSIWP